MLIPGLDQTSVEDARASISRQCVSKTPVLLSAGIVLDVQNPCQGVLILRWIENTPPGIATPGMAICVTLRQDDSSEASVLDQDQLLSPIQSVGYGRTGMITVWLEEPPAGQEKVLPGATYLLDGRIHMPTLTPERRATISLLASDGTESNALPVVVLGPPESDTSPRSPPGPESSPKGSLPGR